MPDWQTLIRDVRDFPRPGVTFKDITPLLADADGYAAAIDAMAAPWRGVALDAVLGIEARGFILGAALARALGTGFVPIRKPGKLPGRTHAQAYALEYGSDRLEIHADDLPPGARVLIVDDVLATGGTLRAALALARRQGALVVGAAVLLEIAALGGRADWDDAVALEVTVGY
ncbi:adenine phosphoribosyltransferase [Luteimonas notoginsengisoli]|uniref:Adenine phosphoribosyltransferase n=1 Tax=Luteimonas notoginsengisoli TaxID=1578200 RepID=A0ABV7UY94_9GAMM